MRFLIANLYHCMQVCFHIEKLNQCKLKIGIASTMPGPNNERKPLLEHLVEKVADGVSCMHK